MLGLFLCFKQKTAYEMRISDWSSDVCSSDLFARDARQLARALFIFPRKRQVVAHGYAECEERADLLAELGTSDREAVFLCGKLGFGQRHPRLAPAADVEPLIDRGRRFGAVETRSEEHTSELQSQMRISYAVSC